MNTENPNFRNTKNALSRAEMKKIVGGKVDVICPSGYVVCNCDAGGVNTVTCIPKGADCCKPVVIQ